MANATPVAGYSRLQIALHWLVVLFVLAEYATSDFVERGGAASSWAWLHVWPGIVIVVLMAIRLLVRMVQGAPEPPESEHPLLRQAAKLTHVAFYILMFTIPLGGLADRYLNIPGGMLLHDASESIFFIIMWLHIIAALAHHFVLRTDVLRRMLKPAR